MKKKILLHEKDPFILDLLHLVLKDSGYLSLNATEEDFLTTIERFQPDAILLDIIAPSVIGTKICEDIKNHPVYNEIPVIVLSTHPNIEVTKNICADEVVHKPFDIDFLLHVIQENLQEN